MVSIASLLFAFWHAAHAESCAVGASCDVEPEPPPNGLHLLQVSLAVKSDSLTSDRSRESLEAITAEERIADGVVSRKDQPADGALCLVGEARTFMMPLVYTSMKINLVDTLGADVFAILKKLNENRDVVKKRNSYACDFNESEMNSVLYGVMGAKNVSYIYSDHDIIGLRNCKAPGAASVQLRSKYMCFQMVQDHEKNVARTTNSG